MHYIWDLHTCFVKLPDPFAMHRRLAGILVSGANAPSADIRRFVNGNDCENPSQTSSCYWKALKSQN
jgi:hypothetical protein